MEEKRLSKALAAAGVASRRACEELIFEGRVTVNGKTVLVPQTMVNWDRDQICVDGSGVKKEQRKLYFFLNKPSGYLCTNARPKERDRIVLDLFAGYSERLFTVGRLDKETTGLLLVTNDGHFANQVIHPSSNIEKEYLLKTTEEVTEKHLKIISRGAPVDGRWVRPVSVRKVRRGTVKICVKEGKKHEVRLLAERAGLPIMELTRIRIGDLLLGSMPEGTFRPLTKKEIDYFTGRPRLQKHDRSKKPQDRKDPVCED
jgi:23S rRNA pseudouridine2605 synthase